MKRQWGPFQFTAGLHGPYPDACFVPGHVSLQGTRVMEDFLFDADGAGISAAILKRRPAIEHRPRRIDPAIKAEAMPGHWWFGGFLFSAYGHQISEGLSRIWAPILHATGKAPIRLVFVDLSPTPETTKQAFARLVRLFFRREVEIRFVGPTPHRFAWLHVPDAALEYPFNISPMMQVPLGEYRAKMRDSTALLAPRGPERLYLSRSRMGQDDTRSDFRSLRNEDEIERVFAAHGFEIVHPQDIPFAEQIALYRNARVMAGPNGSALHNCMFSLRCEKMIEILTPPKIWGAKLQNSLNRFMGIEQSVLWSDTVTEDRQFYELDLAELETSLRRL